MKRLASCCEHGADAFSYDTCIRTQLNGKWILNVTKYSPTTSRHQKDAFGSLEGIRVTGVPRGTTANELRNLAEESVVVE